MGNLCSRTESIRNIEAEIEELRGEMARLARGREEAETSTGIRTTTASGSSDSGSRTFHLPTAATKGSRIVRHRGGPGVPGRSEAAIEAVIGGRGTRNSGRARS
ncbi:hypothetical protein L873DRAFT_1806783 [Choiromyces venosus 120613-1]|uniref:Uncharacterized protein n=1 Tax=Choiromyces venosus 120613-1 TaxID=1336337 RepID=A0A3N4JT12_9PEZI|nr:hypothetical protein L873DRAFT_1806783 [Choiromyces venosus 120613-1]